MLRMNMIIRMQQDISLSKFHKDILKYVAPYFEFDTRKEEIKLLEYDKHAPTNIKKLNN